MQKFPTLIGIIAHLPMINIDTDMIIPKQFLKTIKRSGLGKYLFYEMRYTQDGHERAEFILNKSPYRRASVLVTGANFGCGSSREHAPWAILDFGIRCLIAPSYADIFFSNCFKNGILPIILPQEQVDSLIRKTDRETDSTVIVNLERQEIQTTNNTVFTFDIDAFRKRCLLEGIDEIEVTLRKMDKIALYEALRNSTQSWLKL